MRTATIAALSLLLSASTIFADDHTHATNEPLINSESDRLIAMFYESQCMDQEAREWYIRSLAHFPKNKLSQKYLREMPRFMKEESKKWTALARKTKDAKYYVFAIECDISNIALWNELNGLFHAQENTQP